VLSIAFTHWTQVARIVRSEILGLREQPYIDAAVLAGATRRHLVAAHVLPAVLPQALIAVVLLLPHAIWHESTLSFLGFGLAPHEPSLGTLLSEARSSLLLGGWWTLVFPAGILVLATVAVAVLGSTLRQAVSPPKPSELRL
jgi:ABC-type dipeptide/oligopeptide/nickel transport system permease subunit